MYQATKTPPSTPLSFRQILYDSQLKTNPTLPYTNLPYTRLLFRKIITHPQLQKKKYCQEILHVYKSKHQYCQKNAKQSYQTFSNASIKSPINPTTTQLLLLLSNVAITNLSQQATTSQPNNATPTTPSQPQRSSVAAIQSTTPTPNQQHNRLSTYFQNNINWWGGHILYNKTKLKRFTPFQLFPHTTPKEREKYFEKDEEGEYLPGTLRPD